MPRFDDAVILTEEEAAQLDRIIAEPSRLAPEYAPRPVEEGCRTAPAFSVDHQGPETGLTSPRQRALTGGSPDRAPRGALHPTPQA